MSDISRNAPCPCGSGKKYKHCCLHKKEKPLELLTPEKLQKLGVNIDESHQDHFDEQTFMESIGSANMATDLLNEIKKQIEEQGASSEEDIQKIMNQHMESNFNSHDDFLGLSPNQMHILLNGSFEDQKLFSFNKELGNGSYDNIPVLRWADFLLKELSNFDKGVKLTKNGNFPLKIVQPFHQEFCTDSLGYKYTPRSELDVPRLETIKIILKDTGYIKKQLGKISLTKKGIKFLEKPNIKVLYQELYDFYTNKFNWLYVTVFFEEADFIRQSHYFSLHLLNLKAQKKIGETKLSDIFIKAFPHYDTITEYGYSESRRSFSKMFLENFAWAFGLLESFPIKKYHDEKFYKVTPFFKEFFIWHKL